MTEVKLPTQERTVDNIFIPCNVPLILDGAWTHDLTETMTKLGDKLWLSWGSSDLLNDILKTDVFFAKEKLWCCCSSAASPTIWTGDIYSVLMPFERQVPSHTQLIHRIYLSPKYTIFIFHTNNFGYVFGYNMNKNFGYVFCKVYSWDP